jgi:hypothetical protein
MRPKILAVVAPSRLATWLLVSLVCSGLLLQACDSATPSPTPEPTVAPADSSSKIDTVLLQIYIKYTSTQGTAEQKQQAAIDYAKQQGWINKKDEMTFEVALDSPTDATAVTDKLKSMGARVIDSQNIGTADQPQQKMRVAVPVSVFVTYANSANKQDFLRDLADFKGIKSINVVLTRNLSDLNHFPETTTALAALAVQTKNEGVKIMGVDKWQAAGFTGKGVKIGIVDGGFKYYDQFLGTTLPANLVIKDMDADIGNDGVIDETVHGTAVLEIIHSLAPDATLIPVAVDGSEEEETAAFDYLAQQNVSIISMSMGGHGTPGDGSQPEDLRIEALRQRGILLLFSAGNEGDSHYAGVFSPDNSGYQQFLPGVNKMAVGNPGSTAFETNVILNWEQWHLSSGVKPTDLDLFVEDKNGTPISSSQNDQRSREPFEYVSLKIPPKTNYYIKIRLKPGTPKPSQAFRLHIFTHDVPVQFDVPEMSIAEPAASKGALAVGAIQFDTDVVAYYSSRGPLPDGRMKPDIAAPAGISSAAYALEGEDGFDGTSAACPEAAGLAAVLKGANSKLTADQLAELLRERTKKLNGSGNPDDDYGYGRVDLTNSQPGDTSIKNNLGPAPTLNNNPPLTPTIVKYYPTPVGVAISPKANQAPTATQTQAAVAGPTPTAAPTPQSVAPVSFRDSFNDPQTGLPNNDTTTYGKNQYEIKPSAGQLAWGIYPDSINVTDFAAEVGAKGISGNAGLYGLIFWFVSPSDYYILGVTGDGKAAAVQHFTDGSWQSVIGWSAISSWKANTTNKIKVVANSGQLSILVNGSTVKVGSAQGQGGVGFAAGSYGTAGLNAVYQDFTLSTRS